MFYTPELKSLQILRDIKGHTSNFSLLLVFPEQYMKGCGHFYTTQSQRASVVTLPKIYWGLCVLHFTQIVAVCHHSWWQFNQMMYYVLWNYEKLHANKFRLHEMCTHASVYVCVSVCAYEFAFTWLTISMQTYANQFSSSSCVAPWTCLSWLELT